jgi:hypothetical protein
VTNTSQSTPPSETAKKFDGIFVLRTNLFCEAAASNRGHAVRGRRRVVSTISTLRLAQAAPSVAVLQSAAHNLLDHLLANATSAI